MYTDILKASTPIESFPLRDDIEITWELMGAKEIRAEVLLPGVLTCPVGAYIMHKGEPYTVNTVPSVSKGIENGALVYKYSVVFESILYRLYDKKLRHLGNRTFQFFCTPAELAKLIVDCINEIDPGWTVGVCDDLDPKTINFSGHTCRTALDVGAEAWGIEWDVTGKVIRFTKQVGTTRLLTFKYGQGNGLYSLSYAYQNDKNIVTRAYGYGSTRNLPEDYRDGATQLMFDEGYLENNVALYGVKEGDYENQDIYPEVKGTISDAVAWVEGSGTFKVTDDSLTFDLNDYKSVETPKLSFTTGELQGQEFDILDFDNATKTYTLKVFQDGNNLTLPNATFQAQPGDTYTLFDMPLPTELVAAAEAKLRAATLEWLNTNSKPQVLYSLELDPLYARDNNIMLQPGDRVTIVDEALGINELIRVSKVQYPVNFPEQITPSTKIIVEIANFVPYTLTERVLSDIQETKQQVKTTISKSNYFKRMAEYVKTLTGVDYLPPNTAIIDPATGTITANLINADYIVARNLLTGKVRITAEDNNIIIEDEDGNAMTMIDDDVAIEGYTLQPNDFGRPTIVPVYGPGIRIGLSPNNSQGFASMGRRGFFTNWTYRAGGNGKEITMDRDGFTVNSGKRTISGSIIIPPFAGSTDNKKLLIENGLIVGYETATTPGSITVNDPTSLPVDNTNDTGYVPDTGGGVDPPINVTPTTLTAKFPFPTGTAIKENLYGSSGWTEYTNIANTQFDRWTSENACKMGRIVQSDLSLNWTSPDNFMNKCKAANKKALLHCVVWANEMPDALVAKIGVWTTVEWTTWLTNYVTAYLDRYLNTQTWAGIVTMVDLINEPLSNSGALKTSQWKTALPNFIDVAFAAAQPFANQVLLGINDYDFEYPNSKAEGMIALRDSLAAQGSTMHYVGSQNHSVARVDFSVFRSHLKKLSDAGLKVHISELDVAIKNGGDPSGAVAQWSGDPTLELFTSSPALQAIHRDFFVGTYSSYIESVADENKVGITQWSVGDRDNSRNNDPNPFSDFPTIWNYDYSVKALTFDALMNLPVT